MSLRTIFFGMLLLAAGCAPQAELVKLRGEMGDLRTEMKTVRSQVPDLSGMRKRQDLLEENIKGTLDLQQKMADQGARQDQLVTDLQILQGRLEENNFRIKEIAQKLDDGKFKLAELAARMEQLENKTKSQPTGTAAAGAGDKKSEAKQPTPSEAGLRQGQLRAGYRGIRELSEAIPRYQPGRQRAVLDRRVFLQQEGIRTGHRGIHQGPEDLPQERKSAGSPAQDRFFLPE